MKPKIMTDFSTLIPNNDVKNNLGTPIYRDTYTKHSNLDRSIHTEGNAVFICPSCKSNDFVKNGKIYRSQRKQYRCSCGKKFSLSIKCVDIKLLINSTSFHPYDLAQFKAKKKYMKRFDTYLIEATYTSDGDIPKVIEIAFKKIMKYIHRCEEKRLSKEADSFLFLSTSNNEDILYHTRFQHLILTKNFGIDFFSSQPQKYPLILCQCGSPGISRYGFNNNGKRRLRCYECGKTFVIKLKNILPKSLFNIYCRQRLLVFLPRYKLIDKLIELLYNDFYHSEFFNYFEELVSRIELITHRTAYLIIELFIIMNMKRFLYVMSIEYNMRDLPPVVKSLDEVDIGMSFYSQPSVTNIEYIEKYTNLDILKNNEKHIKYVLKFSEYILSKYPFILDTDWLLKDAVESAKINFFT